MLHFVKFLIVSSGLVFRNYFPICGPVSWNKGKLDEQNFNWYTRQAAKLIHFGTSKVLYLVCLIGYRDGVV